MVCEVLSEVSRTLRKRQEYPRDALASTFVNSFSMQTGVVQQKTMDTVYSNRDVPKVNKNLDEQGIEPWTSRSLDYDKKSQCKASALPLSYAPHGSGC